MPSYQLPKDRGAAVAAGLQTFALQFPRPKTSPRHVRVGETITVRPGGEASIAGTCVARALIHMDKDGIRRVLEPSVSGIAEHFDAGQPILARLADAENGSAKAEATRNKVAAMLGYDDYPALFAAELAREDGRGKVSRGVIAREVVGWMRS
jgi:hypothetical protein